MGSVFTVLIALGLMQHPNIDDRREKDSRYIGTGWAIGPAPDPYVAELKQLYMHGIVAWHDRASTPLSRALGEDELIRMKP
jgi:hypothetical protein